MKFAGGRFSWLASVSSSWILLLLLITNLNIRPGCSFLPNNHDASLSFKGRYTPKAHAGVSFTTLAGVVPGADIEQPTEEEEATAEAEGGDIPLLQQVTPRGKVNEVDFCIAPADVSLSRAYGLSASTTAASPSSYQGDSSSSSSNEQQPSSALQQPILSLTRALNNASNRAVRRILLARSWPSAEALNLSLRQVAAAEKQRQEQAAAAIAASSDSTAKCPVPRPILNVLTRKRNKKQQQQSTTADGDSPEEASTTTPPRPRSVTSKASPGGGRTDGEYVADQLANFRQRYGNLPAYAQAEDYLKAILSLATTGVESTSVQAVLQAGVYDESYKRVLSVLKTCGVVLEPVVGDTENAAGLRRIAKELNDRDFCLSVLDKIQIRKEKQQQQRAGAATAKKEEPATAKSTNDTATSNDDDDGEQQEESSSSGPTLTQDDLGGVLLSATLPTMTRQLNALANICERALLFGGDQELLVLAETLDADRNAFIERWYPGTSSTDGDEKKNVDAEEIRPGVQFLNAMIQLLRNCHDKGIVYSLDPPCELAPSYANAYERLVASAVELGSGYLKPFLMGSSMDEEAAMMMNGGATGTSGTAAATTTNMIATMSSLPKPRTAQEELGRFAVWESNVRQQGTSGQSSSWDAKSTYPDDLVGTWQVRDEIGGETIGRSTITLKPGGEVQVSEPLEGLRWRLDPGPTHLDTCTFQVLSRLDGTVLQYRGFLDRGARLEARFSKRSLQIRGSVMFQMRNGANVDYYRDILPINYRTGTTKFVMTQQLDDDR